jgi:hypothetical protein
MEIRREHMVAANLVEGGDEKKPAALKAALKAAADAAWKAAEAAEAASKAASKAATAAPGTQGAADAAEAAREAAATAHDAALVATAAATTARTAAAPTKVRWRDSWPFLRKGLRDFKSNIKRTWPIILGFIAYLFASASVLYGFLRIFAQIPSWIQALYRTWLSMSTASELTSRSSKLVWALGAFNTFIGLLFFGFIVWLVTTSLDQRRGS